MKFFLDENIPQSVLDAVRELGLEAEHARDAGLRAPRITISRTTRRKGKPSLSRKTLFGSPLLYPRHSHYGVLIVRLPHYSTAEQITATVKKFLSRMKLDVLAGAITVLEPGRYRIRKLA